MYAVHSAPVTVKELHTQTHSQTIYGLTLQGVSHSPLEPQKPPQQTAAEPDPQQQLLLTELIHSHK